MFQVGDIIKNRKWDIYFMVVKCTQDSYYLKWFAGINGQYYAEHELKQKKGEIHIYYELKA